MPNAHRSQRPVRSFAAAALVAVFALTFGAARADAQADPHNSFDMLISGNGHTVLDYNTSIATIPNVLIAGPLGFDKREFFDAEPEAEQVPTVDLGFGKDDDKPAS